VDGGLVFVPGVPGFPPGASCRADSTKSPRREPGDSGYANHPGLTQRTFAAGVLSGIFLEQVAAGLDFVDRPQPL
jgi:hypothetical protein